MKKLMIALMLVAPFAFAQFPISANSKTVDVTRISGNWDSFAFKWIGMNDQRVTIYPTSGTSAVSTVGLSVLARISRDGTVYTDVLDSEVTKAATYFTFDVSRTNIPPDGPYRMEVWAYTGSTNTARTFAQGSLNVSQSLYSDTNTFPFRVGGPVDFNLYSYLNIHKLVAGGTGLTTTTNANGGITLAASSSGDMTKAVYDTNANNKADYVDYVGTTAAATVESGAALGATALQSVPASVSNAIVATATGQAAQNASALYYPLTNPSNYVKRAGNGILTISALNQFTLALEDSTSTMTFTPGPGTSVDPTIYLYGSTLGDPSWNASIAYTLGSAASGYNAFKINKAGAGAQVFGMNTNGDVNLYGKTWSNGVFIGDGSGLTGVAYVPVANLASNVTVTVSNDIVATATQQAAQNASALYVPLGTKIAESTNSDYAAVANLASNVTAEMSNTFLHAWYTPESEFTFDGAGTITAYSGINAEVRIPPTIGGVAVTNIGANSFPNNTTIKTLVCPVSVTSIGASAFQSCLVLTSVSLPSVTSIGANAFQNCTALTSVSLPSVTSVGTYAFQSCTALTSISLPSATSIGDNAFEVCTALTSVSLPSATSIGDSAFQSCTALTSISLPSATSIGSQAVNNCTALTSISLPSVASIGDNVFNNCSSLVSLYFSLNAPTLGTTPIPNGTAYYPQGRTGYDTWGYVTTSTWVQTDNIYSLAVGTNVPNASGVITVAHDFATAAQGDKADAALTNNYVGDVVINGTVSGSNGTETNHFVTVAQWEEGLSGNVDIYASATKYTNYPPTNATYLCTSASALGPQAIVTNLCATNNAYIYSWGCTNETYTTVPAQTVNGVIYISENMGRTLIGKVEVYRVDVATGTFIEWGEGGTVFTVTGGSAIPVRTVYEIPVAAVSTNSPFYIFARFKRTSGTANAGDEFFVGSGTNYQTHITFSVQTSVLLEPYLKKAGGTMDAGAVVNGNGGAATNFATLEAVTNIASVIRPAANGTNAIRITDFTGTTNTMIIDSVNNRVGIGKQPTKTLDILGTLSVSSDLAAGYSYQTAISSTSGSNPTRIVPFANDNSPANSTSRIGIKMSGTGIIVNNDRSTGGTQVWMLVEGSYNQPAASNVANTLLRLQMIGTVGTGQQLLLEGQDKSGNTVFSVGTNGSMMVLGSTTFSNTVTMYWRSDTPPTPITNACIWYVTNAESSVMWIMRGDGVSTLQTSHDANGDTIDESFNYWTGVGEVYNRSAADRVLDALVSGLKPDPSDLAKKHQVYTSPKLDWIKCEIDKSNAVEAVRATWDSAEAAKVAESAKTVAEFVAKPEAEKGTNAAPALYTAQPKPAAYVPAPKPAYILQAEARAVELRKEIPSTEATPK